MAENKNSFIIYTDWKIDFEFLTDEEAGKLIKHLLRFASDENPSLENEDRLLQFAAQKMKAVMKKDLKKYEAVIQKRAEAGKKGGVNSGKSRTSKQNEANEANASTPKQNERDNVNDNVICNNIRDINISFVAIKDFDEYAKSFPGDKKHLLLAYYFWDLWHRDNPNSKTTKEARVGKWVDDMRKIIELDKTSIERMVGIYCYFSKCAKGDLGFDDFWFKTIKSIGSFRKKSKTDVYYIDQIIDKVNDKRDKDIDFLRYVDNAIKRFNLNKNLHESSTLPTQAV